MHLRRQPAGVELVNHGHAGAGVAGDGQEVGAGVVQQLEADGRGPERLVVAREALGIRIQVGGLEQLSEGVPVVLGEYQVATGDGSTVRSDSAARRWCGCRVCRSPQPPRRRVAPGRR